MIRYISKHNEKNVEHDVRCVLILLTTTNRVRYNKRNPKSSLDYTFKFSKKF